MEYPKTGYSVDVDVAGGIENVGELRDELGRETGSVRVNLRLIERDGPGGGNPNVRLNSLSRRKLEDFLAANGYDRESHPIRNNRNPDAIRRGRSSRMKAA